MKYHIKTTIFDCDGVIIDSANDIINAVQYTLKYFNRPILPREEIIGYVGHGVEWLIKKSFQDCNDDIINQAIPVYRNYYLENAAVETKLYENVKETLEEIKKNTQIKIALVTNKPEDLTKIILDKLRVREYFNTIVGPESVNKLKPDPEGIYKVLEEFKISASQAIMIGDSFIDIEAGRNAGTITCGVTYGLGDREALIKSSPDILINDLSKLLAHIGL